jgi:hypothetical protein
MGNTDVSNQAAHMAGLKHIFHQAVVFMHKKCIAISGHDTRCVLTTMLQYQQTIIQQLVNWVFTYNAYDSAHE